MTPPEAPFTQSQNDRLEATARGLMARIVETVGQAVPGPILLGGSAGRGEAVLEWFDGRPMWRSDVEAYVLSDKIADRRLIREMGSRLRDDGASVSLNWMTPERWLTLSARNWLAIRGRLTLQMYDLTIGGRWLRGELPSRSVPLSAVARDEGLRLVLNRVVELSSSRVQSVAADRIRWFAKLAVAAYDSHALTLGYYDPFVAARIKRLASDPKGIIRDLNLTHPDAVGTLTSAAEHLLGGKAPDETQLRRTAVGLGRDAVRASLLQLTGWFDPDARAFANGFASHVGRKKLFRSYAWARISGGPVENLISLARSGARSSMPPRALFRRDPLLFVPWSGAMAMLDLLDSDSTAASRATAESILEQQARELGHRRGNPIDYLVDIWARTV